MIVSLVIIYTPSVSYFAIIYASVSMISLVGLPVFTIVVRLITYLTHFLITFTTAIMPHWCFIEVYFSVWKSTLRVYHRVVFGTPNSSIILEYLDFTIILLSQDTWWSHSVYNWILGDVIHILYLAYIYICSYFGSLPNECLILLNGF